MKAYVEIGKKYYKYIYIDWARPKLTANGTLGGSSFAVSATSTWSGYPAYYSCDESTGTRWLASSGSRSPFIFYNPKPLKVTKIVVPSQHTDSGIGASAGIVEGSNDNVNWKPIGSFTGGSWNAGFTVDMNSNTDCYNYYKITPTTATGGNWGMSELRITAEQREVIEGTESDYDYYIEIPNCKLPKIDETYYGIGE